MVITLLLASCGSQSADADVIIPTPDRAEAPPPLTHPIEEQVSPEGVTDPNPPHGDPGHRCEIAVGASLSSAPPPGMADPEPSTAPAFTTIPASPAAGAAGGGTPPGMNPPHGEPGHDCNVAVGSPLPR